MNLINYTKSAVGDVFGLFGYELRRKRTALQSLSKLPFSSVIDVGANAGQFAWMIRTIRSDVFIHSFEPLQDLAARVQHMFALDARINVHAFAIGDYNGDVLFNRNQFDASSSIRELAVAHQQIYPFAAKTSSVPIKMVTLDTWANDFELEGPILLKLDVQGYEREVILGAQEVLKNVKWILSEVSFQELYRGQALFDDFTVLLRGNGFRLMGFFDCHYDNDGNCLYGDALYGRI